MRRRVGEIWIGDRDRIWFFVIVTSLAALGVSLIMILTRWGPGLFDLDSFNYLASAQSLAAGEGFMVPANPARLRPMLYFAPFFSVVLALFERLGVNAIVGARWFNALLFGTNLFIFTSIILMASGSRGLALAASFLFLFSPDLIRAHAWVLSEPLLITLMLLALFSKVAKRFAPQLVPSADVECQSGGYDEIRSPVPGSRLLCALACH